MSVTLNPSLNLVKEIKEGNTSLQILGDFKFHNKIISLIKKISENPLGMKLLNIVVFSEKLTVIKEGNAAVFCRADREIEFCLKERCITAVQDAKGDKFWFLIPPFLILIHELIHSIHEDFLTQCPATLPLFPNLEEEFTITGWLGDYYWDLNERSFATLYKLPSRLSYYVSKFPAGNSPNDTLKCGLSRFHEAVSFGMIRNVKKLLENGASLEATNSKGMSPLCLAAANHHLDVAQLLLDKGANVNAPDKEGNTAVMYAVRTEDADMLELLLDMGADIDWSNNFGFASIHIATLLGNYPIAEILCKRGANVKEVASSYAYSVLHLCLSDKLAELFIHWGADPNALAISGWTPLHIAAAYAKADVIEALSEQGADFDVKDKDGKTPLALAEVHQKSNKKFLNFLKNKVREENASHIKLQNVSLWQKI